MFLRTKHMFGITPKKYSKAMLKTHLLVVFFSLNLSCHTDSKVNFQNKELEKGVKIFLKDMKENNLEIMSVIVESYREQDSVFITLTNSYPDITKIKAYAKYDGVYFCFAGDYPLSEYYKVLNPEPLPSQLKKKYDDFRRKRRAINYEPFTKMFTFYKGRIVEPLDLNKE